MCTVYRHVYRLSYRHMSTDMSIHMSYAALALVTLPWCVSVHMPCHMTRMRVYTHVFTKIRHRYTRLYTHLYCMSSPRRLACCCVCMFACFPFARIGPALEMACLDAAPPSVVARGAASTTSACRSHCSRRVRSNTLWNIRSNIPLPSPLAFVCVRICLAVCCPHRHSPSSPPCSEHAE